jgi:Uma2 family endonuclease
VLVRRRIVTAVTTLFTRADHELLPEGFPAELIEGRLVKDPAPTCGRHVPAQRLLADLAVRVGERAVMAPIDVGVDEWNVFQPNVALLAKRTSPDVHDVGIPRIAFEVLSRSTAQRVRGPKRARLLAAGVREPWIVDPAAGTVEVHAPDGLRAVARGDERIASEAVPGSEVVPSRRFAPPRG